MPKPLDGKVALVTGGARGIGAAIARRLADDGADVAVSYVSSAAKADELTAELRGTGVRAAAYRVDAGDGAETAALVRSVVADLGALDVLVNNAGVFVGGAVDDPDVDLAALERQLAVNVGGVAAAVRAAAPVIREGGRIITIGSINASMTPRAGFADYGATKAAVAAYTRAWAHEFAKRAVTVNTVQPGPIDTDMNPDDGSERAKYIAGRVPLGRYGTAGEVAATVAFLAGPGAAYITGATINVDGGISA